ncbi:transglycosylase domain-containing protein [Paenibacillus harenae]|uniref:Penicillin-binding protein 2A n=1 Tax=Paenibacillus harenae TaxID=306543 RepID=A0ABT9TYG5_PAEHA|nr:PBP1A family penicillin-binding protein [Paenibacillus harenae]MDQ0112077.1 penicillin-binding protein 2A [Paenibacillus harenae]
MESVKKRTYKNKKAFNIAIVLLSVIVMLAAAAWVAFRLLVGAQDIGQLETPLPAATIVYDKEGKEASRISLNKIEEIKYASIPIHLIHAVIAIEDKRFLEHDGMDVRAIGRAFWTNLSAGGTMQGGSTITQQLAKNVFLTHERTWSRKWNEVLLAKKIEENYSKERIMEMYLNQIYYGEGAWGVKRAAYTYFGKEADRLTVAEAALLAGLIKAPSALTPYKHLEKATERRNLVLQQMKEQAFIDAEVYNAAVKEPVSLLKAKPNRVDDIRFPYYVDQMIREAMSQYGLSENEVLLGGLRIYTELDAGMQQAAEQVYAEESLFPQSTEDQLIQSGAALVDPKSGGIRALVGGRGEQPFRGFNRASQLKRQPGSTIKPVAVYAPAMEMGYRPMDTLVDEPINIGGYEPQNAGGGYHGEVTLYEALINSYNIPAVKLLNEIGIDKGMDAAERFGIPLTPADRSLGLALGGLHEGVSPLQMAEAFGVFANEGLKMQAHSIKRIESADGILLAEAAKPEGEQVTEPGIARTITAMLEGVVQEGSGTAAALQGRPVAGKTGTTQMSGATETGAKDNWFVGYTPQLVGAVWLGYDHSDSTHYLTTTSKAAAAVFRALMETALKDEPVIEFPPAPSDMWGKKQKEEKPDSDSGKPSKNKEKNDDNKKSDKQNKRDKKEERDRKRDRDREDDEDDDN